jgi:hypothetical protein
MESKNKRRRGCSLKIALIVLVTAVACLGGSVVAINLSPHLLLRAAGLDRLGTPAAALPPEAAPLTLDGKSLDRVELLLPPHVTEPLTLSAMEASGGKAPASALIGDSSQVETTQYLVTIGEAGARQALEGLIFPEGSDGGRYENVMLDLHPGGATVYADVDLGIRRERMGLLFLTGSDQLTLSPAGLVLDGELYRMPGESPLARLIFPVAGRSERALQALTVVGPLPGRARVEAVRFGHDSIQILARATYALSSLPDTGWRVLDEGVELREIDVAPGPQRGEERLSIVRLNPEHIRLRVVYDPISPRRVSAWRDALGALLVVNGSYFAPEGDGGHETVGLLVSDGRRWGTVLQSHAGMLAVGGNGEVSVRWLRHRPYDPGEPLTQAVQSFPVLVKPGGIMGFPADADDGAPARRTVVAEDRLGNILFIVAPHGTLSLHEMAVFLTESNLDVDVALNLDGGSSTGMRIVAAHGEVNIDSLTRVPSVIAVQKR